MTERITTKTDTSRWKYTLLNGKRPIIQDWPNNPSSADEIAAHRAAGGNTGLITGQASGVVVVDVDEAKGGIMPDLLPDTVTVRTGGGWHLYFSYTMPLGNSAGKLGPHLDIKADRGQVVAAGSVHPETGAIYEYAPGKSPSEIALAPLPEWIIEAVTLTRPPEPKPVLTDFLPWRNVDAALDCAAQIVASAMKGSRNDTLNKQAFKMGQLECRGLQKEKARRMLVAAAETAGLTQREAEETFDSGWNKGTLSPKPAKAWLPKPEPVKTASKTEHSDTRPAEPLTELGAAWVLFDNFKGTLCHHSGYGWLAWDAKRWSISEKRAFAAIQQLGGCYRALAQTQATSDEEQKQYYTFARRLEGTNTSKGVLFQARTVSGLNADDTTFDADPWLFNCLNGTLNLRTGELKKHAHTDRITKLCPTNYHKNATAPRFMAFMSEVFQGDDEIIRWLQWYTGYSLTGCTTAQIFAILHGAGANGKSTLINALVNAVGDDYSHALAPDALMRTGGQQPSDRIAALRGVRFVTAQESAEGARLDEALIKQLTGGDKMRARYLYQNEFEFCPVLKLWLSTNHKPTVRDQTVSMWRRIRLVPFERTFQAHERNAALPDILSSEAAGILAWAVAGVLEHGAQEPFVPKRMERSQTEYQSEEDPVGAFIDDVCLVGERYTVLKHDLYRAYSTYYNGKVESEKRFVQRVRAKGYVEKWRDNGRCWGGLRLRENDEY